MEKKLVLASLFIVPLLFYIFLSSGIYHSANLPILKEHINELPSNSEEVYFNDYYSVLCFFGNNKKTKSNFFNISQTIYKPMRVKKKFQLVAVFPKGMESEVANYKKQLDITTNLKELKTVFLNNEEITKLYQSLDSPFALDITMHCDHAYIIDRENRLRGRTDDEDAKDGILYGYNMNSVSELKNKMKDDIKVIYYQWKKSLEKQERRKRKI